VPILIALIDPAAARLPVGRAADRGGFRTHQRVDKRGEHVAQQIRRRGGKLVVRNRAGSILVFAVIA
jgi:hypothetical protein